MKSQQFIVMRFLVIRLAILMGIGIVADSVHAQPKGGDAAMQQVLRKAQGVIRQLTEEKAAFERQKLELENQKAGLEADKSSLIAEKTALLNDKTSLEAKVKKLETAIKPLEALPAELNRCKLGNQILQQTKTKLMGKVHLLESNNTLLLEAVKERERWITACGKKNQELVTSANELVGKYKDKSIWEEVGDAEPFTGIGRVNTENSAEEYRYKIEHLKATTFESETQLSKEPALSEEVVAPSSVGGSVGHAP